MTRTRRLALGLIACAASTSVAVGAVVPDAAHADQYNMMCFPGIGGGWGVCNESYYDDGGHLVYQHSYVYVGNYWFEY